MTPAAVRTAWIAGLAVTGAAVVGVVAYASSKPSASNAPTTTKPKSTLLPNTQSVNITPKPTTTTVKQGGGGGLSPTTAPPNTQLLHMQTLGQTGLSAKAVAGQSLMVTVPVGVSVTVATVEDESGAENYGTVATVPTYTPNQTSLYGNGGSISFTLEGQPGWVLISGIDTAGHTATTVIPVGSPSGSPVLP
jgi:hypothetical protein